jgi:hypothetical protein
LSGDTWLNVSGFLRQHNKSFPRNSTKSLDAITLVTSGEVHFALNAFNTVIAISYIGCLKAQWNIRADCLAESAQAQRGVATRHTRKHAACWSNERFALIDEPQVSAQLANCSSRPNPGGHPHRIAANKKPPFSEKYRAISLPAQEGLGAGGYRTGLSFSLNADDAKEIVGDD